MIPVPKLDVWRAILQSPRLGLPALCHLHSLADGVQELQAFHGRPSLCDVDMEPDEEEEDEEEEEEEEEKVVRAANVGGRGAA
jgi:hypothetical protein